MIISQIRNGLGNMERLSNEQLLKYLNDLFDCNAFEMHANVQNIYIPYMMNDALECYLLLENGRITGEYLMDFKGDISANYANTENGYAIIFRQGDSNVFTVWFEHAYRMLQCYRYDEIGHFWVKGAEHWRRLVYMIGTIYDKYEYMGEEVCTPEEIALLPLMEFAPFRAYSPIRESLDNFYTDTEAGLATMETLAREAKDESYLHLLKLYRFFPCSVLRNMLIQQLNHPRRIHLYELTATKVSEAAAVYPTRNYSDEITNKIKETREEITATLQAKGFWGSYPLFTKDTMQIFVAEEHPFTILDWEHYSFRTQFMVSTANKPCEQLHYGFFNKSDNIGRIETSLDFLEE